MKLEDILVDFEKKRRIVDIGVAFENNLKHEDYSVREAFADSFKDYGVKFPEMTPFGTVIRNLDNANLHVREKLAESVAYFAENEWGLAKQFYDEVLDRRNPDDNLYLGIARSLDVLAEKDPEFSFDVLKKTVGYLTIDDPREKQTKKEVRLEFEKDFKLDAYVDNILKLKPDIFPKLFDFYFFEYDPNKLLPCDEEVEFGRFGAEKINEKLLDYMMIDFSDGLDIFKRLLYSDFLSEKFELCEMVFGACWAGRENSEKLELPEKFTDEQITRIYDTFTDYRIDNPIASASVYEFKKKLDDYKGFRFDLDDEEKGFIDIDDDDLRLEVYMDDEVIKSLAQLSELNKSYFDKIYESDSGPFRIPYMKSMLERYYEEDPYI